jgi:hypothetical protein
MPPAGPRREDDSILSGQVQYQPGSCTTPVMSKAALTRIEIVFRRPLRSSSGGLQCFPGLPRQIRRSGDRGTYLNLWKRFDHSYQIALAVSSPRSKISKFGPTCFVGPAPLT